MGKLQLKLVRGEDRPLVLRITFDTPSGDPYTLVGWSRITAEFRKSNGGILTITSNTIAYVEYETVVYSAVTPGLLGNDILLDFDGIDTIATVITDWNTANPTNTVSSDAVDDSVVPPVGSAQLVEGVNPATVPIAVVDEAIGKISVSLSDSDTNSLKSGPDQSFRVVVDKGVHPAGTRRIILFDSALNVINADI